MSQEFNESEFAQLAIYSSQGASGLLNYYDLLINKGYQYGSLARGVVTGDTPSGAVARQFANNIAILSNSHPGGLDSLDFQNIAVRLMEADFAAREALFLSGERDVTLDYRSHEVNHTVVFDEFGLPSYAWTPFVPIEAGNESEIDRQIAWERFLNNSDGADFEFLLGLRTAGAVFVDFNFELSYWEESLEFEKYTQLLWTRAMFLGTDGWFDFDNAAMADWLGNSNNTSTIRYLLDAIPSSGVVTGSLQYNFLGLFGIDDPEGFGGDFDPEFLTNLEILGDDFDSASFELNGYRTPDAILLGAWTNDDGSISFREIHANGKITVTTSYVDQFGNPFGTLTVVEEYSTTDATVTKEYETENGEIIGESTLTLFLDGISYESGTLGSLFGSQLGQIIAGENQFARIAAGTVGEHVFERLERFTAGLNGSVLSDFDEFGSYLRNSIQGSLGEFGDELIGELTDETISSISSLLVTEAAEALGIEGFVGDIFTSTGSTITEQLIDNIVANGVDLDVASIFEGFETTELVTSLGQNIGSILANHLGDELIDIDSVGESLFVTVGGSFGSITLGSAITSTLATVVGSSVGSQAGVFLGSVILPGIGTLVGTILGQTVGSAVFEFLDGITGGFFSGLFEDNPWYYEQIGFNFDSNHIEVVNYISDDTTSETRAQVSSITDAYMETVNGVIDSIGGRVDASGFNHVGDGLFDHAYFGYHHGNDSLWGNDDFKVTFGHGPLYVNAGGDVGKIVRHGVEYELSKMSFLAGNAIKIRAFERWKEELNGLYAEQTDSDDYHDYLADILAAGTPSQTPISLLDDSASLQRLTTYLQIADDYTRYLENTSEINALLAASEGSSFSVGWVATLLQAESLGLNNGYLIGYLEGSDTAATLFDDVIVTADGDDLVFADSGNDVVTTYGGDDIVNGGAGDDQIITGDGSDQIFAETGQDIIHAGTGNDVIAGGVGADQIHGDEGTDTATYTDSSVGVTIFLDGTPGEGGTAQGDTLWSIETVITTSFADLIYGSIGGDRIESGNGDDVINAQAGDDTIYPGSGNDVVDAGEGDDFLVLDEGDDTGIGGAGNDRIFGYTGNDFISGNDGDDIISGEQGDDELDGGRGNDHLEGGAGNDVANGGEGNDIILLGPQDDIANGDAGQDSIHGGEGNDQLFGNEEGDFIKGGSGDDIVFGGEGDDFIVGGSGNDQLNGDEGSDRIFALSDNDTVDGGAGDDEIRLDEGDDLGFGRGGDDFVGGWKGSDQIFGGAGNDIIEGGDNSDELWGGSGDDLIYADRMPNPDALPASEADVLSLISNLPEFHTWGLLYQGENYTLTDLASSSHAMLIINSSRYSITSEPNSEVPWTSEEIATIKAGGKLLLGYVNLAKINSFWNDWNNSWTSNGIASGELTESAPSWLGDLESDTTRLADFANPAFQEIVKNRIERMIVQGFNGTLLDDVLEYYARVPQGLEFGDFQEAVSQNAIAMRNFILDLREFADAKMLELYGPDAANNHFNFVVNGAPYILADAVLDEDIFVAPESQEYLNAIDAIVVENYFANNLEAAIQDTTRYFGSNGVPLLSLDTEQVTQQQRIGIITDAVNAGFLPYATESDSYGVLNGTFFEELEDTPEPGNDLIFGGPGADIVYGGLGIDTKSYADSPTGISVDLLWNQNSGGDASGDLLFGIEDIIGTDYSDTLSGDSNSNFLAGGDGDDSLFGLEGDDFFVGGPGSDYIVGGPGYDTLSFEGSSEWVYSDLSANSHWNGDARWDNVQGVENLIGSDFSDRLSGSSGTNVLEGGLGNDVIRGYEGDDILLGGESGQFATRDRMRATITVAFGGDRLFGGEGDDILVGGGGSDFLRGDGGNDIFEFLDLNDSIAGISDRIADFTRGEDRIGVSDLGFTGVVHNQSPSQGILNYYHAPNRTVIESDVGFQIQLVGQHELSESDFIFGV